jgi:hypothetical protein
LTRSLGSPCVDRSYELTAVLTQLGSAFVCALGCHLPLVAMFTAAMRLAVAEGVKHALGVHHPKTGTDRKGTGLPTNPDLSPVTRDYPRRSRADGPPLARRPLHSTFRSLKEPCDRFFEDLFRQQTTAMLFQNHSGFASKPAPPPFSRCHIRCKSFLIAVPNLVAELRKRP